MTSRSIRSPDDPAHGYAGRRVYSRLAGQPTIHGRELGRRLRQAQMAADVDGFVLAEALAVSKSGLSRIMTGVVVPTLTETATLLALCGVGGTARDRILDLCHPRHDTGILRLTDGAQWDALAFHTGKASRLIEYQPMMIPWHAQTDDYAAAWRTSPAGHADGVWIPSPEDRPSAEIRAALGQPHLDHGRIELVLHEWSLRVPTGGPLIRLMQMRRLLSMAKRRGVSLRVIPAHRALPAAALSGFTILQFRDKPNLVYREDPTGGVFCDDPAQVAAHQRLAGHLSQAASDPQPSVELINQIAEENVRASAE